MKKLHWLLATFHHLHDLDLILDHSRHLLAYALLQSQQFASVLRSGEIDPNVLLRFSAAETLLETGRGNPFEFHILDVAVWKYSFRGSRQGGIHQSIHQNTKYTRTNGKYNVRSTEWK
jgi:hypothetical protein